MNVMRIGILGVAAIAAGGAAMLVRGMLGGQTTASQASITPQVATTEVLVAAKEITPGLRLEADLVRWEAWPKSALSPAFITKDKQADIAKAVAGAVVRAPLVAGQPITDSNTVHAEGAGMMAATIKPGLRAIGVAVNAQAIAGGFILPNDRVDVVLTRELPGSTGKKIYVTGTILRDVRVLAIDQTAHEEKDKDSVVGKTATLEMTPDQAELLAQAQQVGIVSLTLRALGDSAGTPVAGNARRADGPARPAIVVFRYGKRSATAGENVAAADTSESSQSSANPISATEKPASTGTGL